MIRKRDLTQYHMFFIILFLLLGMLKASSVQAEDSIELFEIFFREDYESYTSPVASSGTIHILLKNTSNEPVQVEGFTIMGKDADSLVSSRQIVWWDIYPRTIQPGKIGLIKFRLTKRTDLVNFKSVDVSFKDSGGAWLEKYALPVKAPSYFLSYVGFSDSLDEVYIYVQRADSTGVIGSLQKVEWEGEDVTSQVKSVLQIGDDLLFIKVSLEDKLKDENYGTIRVTMEKGGTATYRVRVLKPYFPVGIYGARSTSHFMNYKEHNAYVHFSFTVPGYTDYYNLDVLEMKTLAPLVWDPMSKEEVEMVGAFESALGFYIMDEPDVKDYSSGGLGRTAPELLRRINFIRDYVEWKPFFLAIDNTYRPANWWVYSEIADVNIGHRYPVPGGFEGNLSHPAIARTLVLASSPRPTYNIVKFFDYPPGSSTLKGREARLPTEEEMYIQVIMALSKGAKGISYYIHSGSKVWCGGSSKELWDYVGELNKMITFISPYTSIADWAGNGKIISGDVNVDYLLSADERVLVFVVNKDFKSEASGFTFNPQRGVKVKVDLPRDIKIKALSILDGTELLPFDSWKVENDQLIIELSELKLAEVLIADFS
jgi:hypothetical protein